jgi:cephalosporin hydroxylase
MFPLWEVAIEPALKAATAKRVVEIGALRGETTVKMVESLGPDGELHVIDPVPEFDPGEHERRFAGRYVFHRGLSLDVLPGLPVMDAALIDGDHNWYTVFHELELLAATARRASALLPLLVLHDVGWPYGRRDLYYAPEQIPEDFRQPYEQAGMRPGTRKLLERGGLNPTMNNAVLEGGERNGVMTAVDDFIAEYDRPLRRLVLPIYFGLAIIAEEERLERTPALRGVFEYLEGADGRLELMEVAEDIRLRAMILQHNVFYGREAELERARAKHLGVVKAALSNRHYLEHEVRLEHLWERLQTDRPVNLNHLRDPVRNERTAFHTLERDRFGSGGSRSGNDSFLPLTSMGQHRLDHLERCVDDIRRGSIAGDLVECGTGRGGGAIFLRAYLDVHELAGRRVWVADRFRSSPDPDLEPALGRDGQLADLRADLNLVRDGFDRFDLLDDRTRFLIGPPDETLSSAEIERVALLRIGRSASDRMRPILECLAGRLAEGAFVIIELPPDGDDALVELEAARRDIGLEGRLERVDAGCVAWRYRSAGGSGSASVSRPSSLRTGPPLAPCAPTPTVDLTVVVVLYNMRREAARTLHALSRSYQEGIDDLTYEVLVVDNGSSPDQKVGTDVAESFGPEFRLIDLGAHATPSPVTALNVGIREGRGENYALMIDGAHVLTPGVLRFGVAGLGAYAPAIVATQQWYVGPGQQGDAMNDGYDVVYEDRLFDTIEWPCDGYRLFDIGHFVGDRDWLDGLWESNCLFVPRALLEQVGGFDESFSIPGGGYANLELYERLGSAPGVTVATILGEGSFHQVHGGVTTNQPEAGERRDRVFGYGREYAEQRGRPFRGPGKPVHYVGRLHSPSARRTKARRRTGEAFVDAGAQVQGDGPAEQPIPVPEELRTAFTEAVWRSRPWDHSTWLGRCVHAAPTDLLALQEAVATVRPDWIIEIGANDGGRTLFLASICELIDAGRVLTVDDPLPDDRPRHPRVEYLRARAHSRPAHQRIREAAGDGTRAIVVLGSQADRHRTSAQFEGCAPLVPVGSYVVVTDTILNGHPVWPAFGPGPAEAVKKILSEHGEFVADPHMEKYSLTFNPGGFLKRIR